MGQIGTPYEAYTTAAETVTGDARAATGGSFFDPLLVGGINGPDAVVSTVNGSIEGIGLANTNTASETSHGHSEATTDAYVFGISDVDIFGGLAAGSSVSGQAYGDFNTTASNTTGDSVAESHASAAGISNGDFGFVQDDMVIVNGRLEGIAELSNTVVASTVTGSAHATASGSAVGISNYEVLMGEGVLIGSASNSQVAIASTVSGPMADK